MAWLSWTKVGIVLLAFCAPAGAQDPRRSDAAEDIFAADPAGRKRAIIARLNDPEIDEGTWLRALDQPWPDKRDEEWAKLSICRALQTRAGRRSLRRLEALMRETPQVVRRSVDGPRLVPVHDYPREARLAFDAALARLACGRLDDHVQRLSTSDARASELGRLIGALEASYRAFAPPEGLRAETGAPDWWREQLAVRLRRLGAPGARAFAPAFELVRQATGNARWKLVQAFVVHFADADPSDQDLRAALLSFCDAVLADGDLKDPRELFIVDLMTKLKIAAADECIALFARRVSDPALRGRAVDALLDLGTERAADFLIQSAPDWGDATLERASPTHLGPRIFAALDAEPASTDRFGFFVRLLRRDGWSDHAGRQRLLALLARVRRELSEVEQAHASACRHIEEGRRAGRVDPDAQAHAAALALQLRSIRSHGASLRSCIAQQGEE